MDMLSKLASHKRNKTEAEISGVVSPKGKRSSLFRALSSKAGQKPEAGLPLSSSDDRTRTPSPKSKVLPPSSSDDSARTPRPKSRHVLPAPTPPAITAADTKKSWRTSVMVARQALPQDAWDTLSQHSAGGGSISGRSVRRQSLLQVAAKQGNKSQPDAYDRRRATMIHPISLTASVGVSGAVESESYYQQSVADQRQSEKSRRLREAMSRGPSDSIGDAAVKHAFFQNNIIEHRKNQAAERRRSTFGAMIDASLPANVTRVFVPPPESNRAQSRKRRGMPQQPLIVPGANYNPNDM